MTDKKVTTVSVLDVAAYIVNYLGEIPKAKLWRLVFYCQAWYMVKNNGMPLFKEKIEAWINGPTVRELYDVVGTSIYDKTVWRVPGGKYSLLDLKTKMIIQEVLDIYGKISTSDLIMSTASILPWKITRESYDPMEARTNIIPNALIYDYYKDKHIEDIYQKN